MRFSSMLLGAVALVSLMGAANAEPVRLAPVSYSPEFQTSLHEDFGEREGQYLSEAVTRAVSAALERRGATVGADGQIVVEAIIVDADPNRPTFKQLGDQPGLDMARSLSLGGAELRAVLRGADGQVLSEVSHRRYNHSLEDAVGLSTWGAARQAIRQFADKVADAYADQAG